MALGEAVFTPVYLHSLDCLMISSINTQQKTRGVWGGGAVSAELETFEVPFHAGTFI